MLHNSMDAMYTMLLLDTCTAQSVGGALAGSICGQGFGNEVWCFLQLPERQKRMALTTRLSLLNWGNVSEDVLESSNVVEVGESVGEVVF